MIITNQFQQYSNREHLQCQRAGFNGPVIGPKPTEKNVREFTDEQLKAGQAIIGLQVT